MTLADAKDLLQRRSLFRLPGLVQTWLFSEHTASQRMVGFSFVIRVASALVVFLSQILLARWMGSFEFGTYVYVWTWLLLVGDLIHLGLPMTAQNHIPRYAHSGAFASLRGFLIGSRWLVFAIGTTAGLVGAAIVYLIQNRIGQPVIMPLYLACVSLPLYLIAQMNDGIARSYNWIGLALAPHSLLRPLLLLACIGALYWSDVPVTATTAMAALTAAIWLSSLIQLIVLHRRLHSVVEPGDRRFDVRDWFATSLPIITVWTFYTLLTCTDVLVLQQFRPADQVAHYYAAVKTLSLVTFVYYSVASSMAHRFSACHAAGDLEGLAAITASSVRWIFWPSLAATAAILAIGQPVLSLFGPNFASAYPVMFVLAIGLMARAAVGPAERVLTMVGQQRICMLAYAVAFAVNLTLCLALAGPYGSIGVAIGTSTAFVAESILLSLIAKRRLGLTLFVWQRKRA
jgi:O-antigen/teichoic acid export membrane protein